MIKNHPEKPFYAKMIFILWQSFVPGIAGGFAAWWLWRSYYLANLPTVEKKLRVIVDWGIDLFFKRDVSRLRTFAEEKRLKSSVKEAEVLR